MVNGVGGPGGGGKIGGKPPIGGADAARPAERSGESFGATMEKSGGVEKSAATNPLERLRRGELDLDGYLDVKVHEATAHLEGVLPAQDLEKVRDEIRSLLAEDPDVAAFAAGAGS